jgi:hypothetical protein
VYTEQFTEVHDILATIPPLAAKAAMGAHNTGYVSLADYHRAFIWWDIGEAAQGATMDLVLTQATDAAGAGAKALTTPAGVTKNPAQIVAADAGEHVGIEIRSEELDITNGFVFIQAEVTIAVDTYYYDLVIFGIVSRYEAVGVTDFLYLMP